MAHYKSRNHDQVADFYLGKDSNLILKRLPSNEKEEAHLIEIKEVRSVLESMGGKVEKQSDLLEALEKKLKCGRTKAQNLIKEACEKKLIAEEKGDGKSMGYRLP